MTFAFKSCLSPPSGVYVHRFIVLGLNIFNTRIPVFYPVRWFVFGQIVMIDSLLHQEKN